MSEPFAASVASAPVTSAALEHPFDREQARQCLGGRKLRAVEAARALPWGRARSAPARRARARHRPAWSRRRAALRRCRASPPPGARAARDRRTLRPSPGSGPPGSMPRSSMASQHGDGLRPHAGGAVAEARELERHHQPHVRGRIGSPTPAACDSTMLRCSVTRSSGADVHAREFAEAGIDAVDRLAARDDGVDRPRASPRPPAAPPDRAGRRRRQRRRASRRALRVPA